MWSDLGAFFIKLLHSLTGWIVHPNKGGCCDPKSQKITDLVSHELEKHKKKQ